MLLADVQPFVRLSRVQAYLPGWDGAVGLDNRLFLCIGGSGSIKVNGTHYPLTRGTIIGWRAGMTYSYHPNEEGMSLLGVNYDFTQMGRSKNIPVPPCSINDYHRKLLIEEQVTIDDAPALSGVFSFVVNKDIVEKINLINLEYSRHILFSRERCNSLLKDVLVQCARLAQTGDSDASLKIAEAVISYVGAHINARLTNASVGEHFNYHPNYISRVMRELTGMSLHSYVLDRRIGMAMALLESTTLSITEIADKTGFGDVSHFSKIFRQKTGKSPTDFRS